MVRLTAFHPCIAENKWHYEPGDTKEGGSKKFILVHQTPEEQRMLRKYGHTVGMDATYKTTIWGFPLVLLVVVDNHRHGYPVGIAFLQTEESSQYAEVLRV